MILRSIQSFSDEMKRSVIWRPLTIIYCWFPITLYFSMIYSRLAELFGPDSGLVLPIANLEHEGDAEMLHISN